MFKALVLCLVLLMGLFQEAGSLSSLKPGTHLCMNHGLHVKKKKEKKKEQFQAKCVIYK